MAYLKKPSFTLISVNIQFFNILKIEQLISIMANNIDRFYDKFSIYPSPINDWIRKHYGDYLINHVGYTYKVPIRYVSNSDLEWSFDRYFDNNHHHHPIFIEAFKKISNDKCLIIAEKYQ
jgi:hypothetical protein